MNRLIRIMEPGVVEVSEAPIPRPQAGEALLKTLYGGICGSDLNSYRGTSPYVTYPRIPGHEFSAEIVEIEENALGLKKGQRVTANPYFNCGHCYSCRRGLVNCCESNQTMGVQREGAFAQYFTMPISRIYDGQGLDPRILALIEPLCIGYHGAKSADIRPRERVLVMGAGTIGLLAAMAAQKLGGDVSICDISQDKLDHAMRNGIESGFLCDDPECFLQNVNRITGGNGFDVTIEAVGLPETFQRCIDAAAFGGRVVLIGVGKDNLDFNFTVLQKKELKLMGSRNAVKQDFEHAIAMVRAGELDLSGIEIAEYALDDAPQAFRDLKENAAHIIKVLIRF